MSSDRDEARNGGFFSRWSDRKRAVAAGEAVAEDAPGLAVETPADTVPVTEELTAERREELEQNRLAAEAIDIDSLDYTSDYSAFFKDGVPTMLRQKALKVLWRSNPILANVDGLCDYDENFGDPSLILTKFESAYKIGKGYLTDEDDEATEDEVVASDDESEPIETSDATARSPETSVSNTEDQVDDEAPDPTTVAANEQNAPDLKPDLAEAIPAEELPERPRVSLRRRIQFEV
ncbi:MAG: DUF3306 domain-containing protein [Pseudomonadota bacterium]